MTKKIVFVLSIAFSCFNSVKADMIAYSDSLTLIRESKKFKLIHFHNWASNSKKHKKTLENFKNPFTRNSNESYLKLIIKKTNQLLIKKSCPALTRIEISPDEKYIIGLSNIKIRNKFQLVIFDINGRLIKKRNISTTEAKLSKSKMFKFYKKFKQQYFHLRKANLIYKNKDYYYINFIDESNKIGKAWDYLIQFSVNNHISNNFSESVTNFIYWYNENNPNLKLIYKNSNLYSIKLLDPYKKTIEIKIIEGL